MNKRSYLHDYDLLKPLGEGSFGTVHLARRKGMDMTSQEEVKKEARLLSRLQNPYIVQHVDSFVEDNNLYIAMEYCERGDLSQFLANQGSRPLPEPKVWKFFIQMCLALEDLHGQNILHRDIKSMNVFLTKDETIKIGDLGIAKVLSHTAAFAHSVIGTPFYMSPELCEAKPYNAKSDMWALGCVLYELCTLRHPFHSRNQAALVLKILQGKFRPIRARYSTELKDLVKQLLNRDFKRRPTVVSILQRPRIREIARSLHIQIPPQSALAEPLPDRHSSEEVKVAESNSAEPAKPVKRNRKSPSEVVAPKVYIKTPSFFVRMAKREGVFRPQKRPAKPGPKQVGSRVVRSTYVPMDKPLVSPLVEEEPWFSDAGYTETLESPLLPGIPCVPVCHFRSPMVVHTSTLRQVAGESSDEAYCPSEASSSCEDELDTMQVKDVRPKEVINQLLSLANEQTRVHLSPQLIRDFGTHFRKTGKVSQQEVEHYVYSRLGSNQAQEVAEVCRELFELEVVDL